MGNAALQIEAVRDFPTLALVTSPKAQPVAVNPEIILLGTILAVIQILDGVLTAMGMNSFGTHAEGNLVLRNLMELVGHVPALIVAKGLALGVIGVLCGLSTRSTWVAPALKIVIGIYLCAAIIPWTFILFVKV